MRIVCGTGRSGTLWAAEALRRCGVRAGHEAVFSTAFHGWGDYEVDVSLAATPYVAAYPAAATHLVRDPRYVVASWLSDRFFASVCDCHAEPGVHLDTPYAWYFRHHAPQIYEAADELGRVLRYVTAWYVFARELPAWRLEDVVDDADAFREFAQQAAGRPLPELEPASVPALNARRTLAPLTWAQLAQHPDGEPVLAYASRRGYLP